MAVSLPSVLRPTLWVAACVLLAPLAQAQVPAASAQPAPAAVHSPVSAGAAPAPVLPAAEAREAAPSPPESSLEALPPELEEESESLGWMLMRTLLLFGAVVACIYLTLNVGLRRLMGLQGVPMGRPTVVSVVERIALDQRRTLFVLKAADEYLLVGGGDSGVQLLSKLDTEAVERIRSERAPSNVVHLSPFLQKLLARRDAPQQGAPQQGAPQPSGTQPPSA